jgi:hypothetical protein
VRLLAAAQPELVAWAWGMNGALSVLGAILAVFIAMNWGFSVTLLCGAVLYGVAALMMMRSAPRPAVTSTVITPSAGR